MMTKMECYSCTCTVGVGGTRLDRRDQKSKKDFFDLDDRPTYRNPANSHPTCNDSGIKSHKGKAKLNQNTNSSTKYKRECDTFSIEEKKRLTKVTLQMQ
jgi:hypothetical protein